MIKQLTVILEDNIKDMNGNQSIDRIIPLSNAINMTCLRLRALKVRSVYIHNPEIDKLMQYDVRDQVWAPDAV